MQAELTFLQFQMMGSAVHFGALPPRFMQFGNRSLYPRHVCDTRHKLCQILALRFQRNEPGQHRIIEGEQVLRWQTAAARLARNAAS